MTGCRGPPLQALGQRERRSHGAQAFIDAAWLDDANAGLIALLGRESDVGRLTSLQRDGDARASLGQWQKRFAGRLYLEITRTGRTGEDAFNASAIELPVVPAAQ